MMDEINAFQNRLNQIIALLEDYFGEPKQNSSPHDLLGSLIQVILSQNTNDVNSGRAYQLLRERFTTYEDMLLASEEEVANVIRSAGLYRQKSKRIKELLNWIQHTFGKLDIDEICDWPTDTVMETLCALKGIGEKSVAVILLFKCGRDIFPVDTHVHRITKRLFLVPQNANAVKTFGLLDPQIPQGKSYSFHVNMLKLGRQICFARKPRHDLCPLKEICPSVDL